MNHLSTGRLRELGEGHDATDDEAEHLIDCPRCGAALSGDPGLDQALDALRGEAPWGEGAGERVGQAIDRELDRRQRRRLGLRAAAAAAAALAAAAGWALLADPRPPSFARVTLEQGAGLSAVQPGPDEVVSLRGEAEFTVDKLPPGARFRVRVGGDEVEVRGTRFQVTAAPGGVAAVAVSEGVVEVRAGACGGATLRAGERWSRPEGCEPGAAPGPASASAAPAPPASAPTGPGAASAPASAAAPRPGAPAPEPAFELMQRGVAAFDAGQYAAASPLLDRAVAAEPAAPWARDARRLSGVARVMLAPVESVASLGVSAEILDAAAQRAARTGDARRAAAARLGAARRSSGDARKKRFCALAADGSLPGPTRAEARRECGP